jgi:hypothetical protein
MTKNMCASGAGIPNTTSVLDEQVKKTELGDSLRSLATKGAKSGGNNCYALLFFL